MEQVSKTPQVEQTAKAEIPERPVRPSNVQLVGELQESGFIEQQWLVQRNGRFVQLTEVLYRIIEHANGERTLEEIAAAVSQSTDWIVNADQVRQLIQNKLVPLGLIAAVNGSIVSVSEDPVGSPLRFTMRTAVLGPRIIDPITRVLQVLYAPPVLVTILIAVTIGHGWLYLTQGHAVLTGLQSILYTPVLLLGVIGIMFLAGIFHEFGHAAALRYGGGKVRGMGVGFYLVYPAIYTDTTDSYRLGRWARVRTDLGGFYFYLIFALAMMGLYLLTGQEFLLMVVLLINVDIVYQSLPFVRFDGYWALADLTGLPDLFTYMKPFIRSLQPGSSSDGNRLPQLKPWVKRVFLSYILLTIPVLSLMLFLFITRAPTIIATTFDSYVQLGGALSRALSHGDLVGISLSVVNMVILALLILGIVYMFYILSRKVIAGIWSLTKRRLRVA